MSGRSKIMDVIIKRIEKLEKQVKELSEKECDCGIPKIVPFEIVEETKTTDDFMVDG